MFRRAIRADEQLRQAEVDLDHPREIEEEEKVPARPQ